MKCGPSSTVYLMSTRAGHTFSEGPGSDGGSAYNADRASDLHSLDLCFVRFLPEGAKFWIPALTKTRRSGSPREAFYPVFKEDLKICLVGTLCRYLDCTASLRSESSPTISNPLFIALKKPHKWVSPASIARWMKELLGKAGINTDVFKAHSTRAASVSAAKMKGVSLRDILDAADWSRESTFRRYYYRPLSDSKFGCTVLTSQAVSPAHHCLVYCFEQYIVIYEPCNDVELKISQGSEGYAVRSEFH